MAVDAARAKSLFLAASDLADPAERAAYLERECGGDAELDRRLAGRTADALLQALSKTTEPYALENLAQGLSAVAARLEPKAAAQLCGQAAATLTQAMGKATLPGTWQELTRGLSAVLARELPPQMLVDLLKHPLLCRRSPPSGAGPARSASSGRSGTSGV